MKKLNIAMITPVLALKPKMTKAAKPAKTSMPAKPAPAKAVKAKAQAGQRQQP